ncbi:MAG: hypothetical protein GX660_16955 [Clostridiaceae bacterium]|nr:hypothetical protein [Clostridiaceae bacterium]
MIKRVKETKSNYKGVISKQSFSEFDPKNGMPSVVTNVIDGNTTNIITTKTTFAYEKYRSMENAHMLIQQCQNTTYSKYGYSDEKVLKSSITTWSENRGASTCAPCSSFVWNTKTDANGYPYIPMEFNFADPESYSQKSWDYTGCVFKYTENGLPIENHNAKDIISCDILGYNDNKTIGSITNGKLEECAIYTCDYDDLVHPDYYDYGNKWKKGGSILNTIHTHFGNASVFIQSSGPGLSKEIIASKKEYIFSCWVYSNTSGTVKLQILKNDNTEINSNNALRPIEANRWIKIERKIAAGTFENNENITIKIAPNGGDIYVDDVRFHPKNALVNTVYYDKISRAPITTVDVNNYASYVEYDDEIRPVLWRNNDKIVTQTKEYNRMSCTQNNTDATLKNIILSEGDIDFDPSISDYHVYLTDKVNKIEITPVINEPDATIVINGEIIPCSCGNPIKIDLPQGITTVNMVVTAPNGVDYKNYNLEFERMNTCWSFIGNRGISSDFADKIQLKNASDGSQYLAFTDKGNDETIIVKKLVNNNWVLVGGGPVFEGEVGSFSLSFSGSTPWIAYTDDSNNEIKGLLKVKRLENGTWIDVGTTIDTDVSGEISILLNIAIPYIAYSYTTIVGGIENSYIKVKSFDGTSWKNLGTDGIVSNEGGSSVKLRNSLSNILYVGYIHEDTNDDDDDKAGKPVIKKYNGATWDELENITSEKVSNFDMELAGNVPYIAFGEYCGNNSDGISLYNVYVKKYDAIKKWLTVGKEYLFETDDNGSIDLMFDNSVIPYLAFTNTDNKYCASVLKYDDNQNLWCSLGNPCFVTSKQMSSLSLNFNSGNAYLAIQDKSYNYKVSLLAYQVNQCSRAVLDNLTINGELFQPDFRHYIVNYTTAVDALTNRVYINASPNSGATVKIGSNYSNNVGIDLVSGLNNIPIIVTGSDLKTKTKYELNITKPLSATASLCNFELFDKDMNSLSYSPAFSSSISDYNITVPDNIDQVIIKLTSSESYLKINGSTSDSKKIPLYYGINNIPFEAVAPDGKNSVRYKIFVIRKIPDNLALSTLTIPSVTLNPSFNSADRETYSYTANVINSLEQIVITPTAQNGTTFSINDNTDITQPVVLNTGINEIFLKAVHPNIGSANYYIKITRVPSDDSRLLSIELRDNSSNIIPVSPGISTNNVEYTAIVANTVSAIEIIPTAFNSNATIKVNNSSLQSGKITIIPQIGINNIEIAVTSFAQDEETVYYLNINKQANTNVPEVGFEIESSEKIEASENIEIPVTVNGTLTQNASVDFVASSLDADGDDYTLTSGRLQFSPCQTKGVINLVIKDDLLTEKNESITVTLQNENNISLHKQKQYTHTIIDNDFKTISFSATTGYGTKSENSPVIYVSIDPAPVMNQTFSVDYNVDLNQSTAVSGVDYNLGNGTLTFDSNNKVRQIPISILDDGTDGSDKTVIINLSKPTNGATIGKIKTFTYTIYGSDKILYVDDLNGSSSGKGYSWTTAYKNLQDALMEAKNSNGRIIEIHVAKGVYYPTNDPYQPNARLIAFELVDNVKLLGGYPSGGGTRSHFDETILSGDIDKNGDFDGNSLHVVQGANTIIDGFSIRNGNANGGCGYPGSGAGLLCINKSLTVNNCDFFNNSARSSGFAGGSGIEVTNAELICNRTKFIGGYGRSALMSTNSEITINDCEFTSNEVAGIFAYYGNIYVERSTFQNAKVSAISAEHCDNVNINRSTFLQNSGFNGGAIQYIFGTGNLKIVNSVFFDNSAEYGGAVYIGPAFDQGNVSEILHCTFSNNHAKVAGGAVYNASNLDFQESNITNSIFWFNETETNINPDIFDDYDALAVKYCDVQNIDFGGPSNNNMSCIPFPDPKIYGISVIKLSSSSCCINKGDPNIDLREDRAGTPRPGKSDNDCGAYEYEP